MHQLILGIALLWATAGLTLLINCIVESLMEVTK